MSVQRGGFGSRGNGPALDSPRRVRAADPFRTVVGGITGIMQAAGYEHTGNCWAMIGGHTEDAAYLVVDDFENFAAMDEDRPGAGGILQRELGEMAADGLREQFGESLEEEGCWRFMARLDPELSRVDDQPPAAPIAGNRCSLRDRRAPSARGPVRPVLALSRGPRRRRPGIRVTDRQRRVQVAFSLASYACGHAYLEEHP